MASEEKAKLRKTIRLFKQSVCADAKAPARIKAVNTLLNSGHNLSILDKEDIEQIWESIFFALWYAEMGRGCEEIIAAVERACIGSYRLTRFGFLTIAKNWYGLDQYRIDKVSHLARHLLPVLLEQQIKLWLRRRSKQKSGAHGVCCRKLVEKAFIEIISSYGLCYFMLEILADEMSKTLIKVIDLATNVKMDSRLLKTYDQYVFKKFLSDTLPNESQLTQILVSLRLYQALDKSVKNDKLSAKCQNLFRKWSAIIQEVHEKCIDGEYFPPGPEPVKSTIEWH